MIVRRLASRGLAHTGSTEADPRRKRASRYLLIIFSAGAISGLAALIGIGPFSDLRVLVNAAVYGGPSQIQASAVFPSAQPTHKTVNVYDPPPAAAEQEPTRAPTHVPSPSAGSTPRPSPRPSPTDH